MSKSLRSIRNAKGLKGQREAIARRLAGTQRGLGYWAAVDAVKRIAKNVQAQRAVKAGQNDAS